ncbi:MAG: MoxR family ATPase [Deltaproteobacteria bacterium]|nr:MoxR family ATPase [Deltaproteobacteria bacterium]
MDNAEQGDNAIKEVEAQVKAFGDDILRLTNEVGKVIVGMETVVEGAIACLLADGHALLEGVPGLGKTMLVRTLAEALSLEFSRVQFTPDLMPADILGTNVIQEDETGARRFEFQKGPVFCHILLADEINRATPKTQSALLEAMQEKSVTIANHTYVLERPFLVLATQNPLEMEGTYPLPEAQLDRFLYKLNVQFPTRDQLHTIMDRTTQSEVPSVSPVLDRTRIMELRQLVRQVPVSKHVQDYLLRILEATHPEHGPAATRKYVRYGASPRGAQGMMLGAKIRALLDGRYAVSCDDVRQVAAPSLRHRIILNFEGEAEGVATDDIITEILSEISEQA